MPPDYIRDESNYKSAGLNYIVYIPHYRHCKTNYVLDKAFLVSMNNPAFWNEIYKPDC